MHVLGFDLNHALLEWVLDSGTTAATVTTMIMMMMSGSFPGDRIQKFSSCREPLKDLNIFQSFKDTVEPQKAGKSLHHQVALCASRFYWIIETTILGTSHKLWKVLQSET
jgi:hypothetical protein